jgi:vancomycin resistance protein YoaR
MLWRDGPFRGTLEWRVMDLAVFARYVSMAGLFSLAVAGGVYARARYTAANGLPGLKVDGVALPEGADVPAFVSTRILGLEARQARLLVDGEDVTTLVAGAMQKGVDASNSVSLGELGVSVDADAVAARVVNLQRGGDVLERADLAARARRGEIDVPLLPRVDTSVLLPLVLLVKEATDVSPVSARLDLDHQTVAEERLGRYVDLDGALEAIRSAAVGAALHSDPLSIVLPTRSFPPHVSRAYVEKLDVKTTLGEYETYFSRAGDQARRGKNIDVAASKIDGLVLSPGELVSFNDVVGERSEDNGFAKSWEIYKGEMIEGVGGGTCQVASTFHAALFFGGMDVIERLPHSRPSAYIPMGLDATVVYPIVDLKVRNPYDFPVVVHASVVGNKLKMQLVGADKPAKVSFQRELVDTFPYKRKIVEEPKLRGSQKVVLKQHGIRGYKIKRTRLLAYRDGTRQKETNTDVYPSTTEIYEVPPGFDVSLLPPLPDEDEDGEDKSDKSDTSKAPAVAPAASEAVATEERTESTLDVVEGPGAHTPTQAQLNPPKTLVLTR